MTTNATYPLRHCDCRRGAPMGRSDTLPDDPSAAVRLSVAPLRWIDGDYDEGGAYWGRRPGESIYRAIGVAGDTVVEVFVRATNRDDAKRRLLARLPGATFYR